MDQPSVALDMINRFINDESFDDFPLPAEGNLFLNFFFVRILFNIYYYYEYFILIVIRSISKL